MSDNLPHMDYRQHRRRGGWYMSAVTTMRELPAIGRRGALRVRPEHFLSLMCHWFRVAVLPLTGSWPQPSCAGEAGNGVPSAGRPLSPNPTGENTAPTAPGA